MDRKVKGVMAYIREKAKSMSKEDYVRFLELIEYEIDKTLEGDITE